MGRNYLADIPGNFFVARLGSHASAASNGAAARAADCQFVAPANLEVLSAWRQVQADENDNSNATRYRDVLLMNGGVSGTVATVTVGTHRSGTGASVAQYGTHSFTLSTTNTVSAGAILYASVAASIGAASDDSTEVESGVIELAYELL